MIPLQFKAEAEGGLNVLCLGAHSDDIEIGCGGAILKLIEQELVKSLKWVVFASNEKRKQEAQESARRFLADLDQKEIIVYSYRDAFLPFSAMEIKGEFEAIKASFNPSVVFTHYRDDRHQDHRLISDLSWNTFRNHLIMEYEIPKYDGDLGIPNSFCLLSKEQADKKIDLLMECFATQRGKHWFDRETFQALMRIRGMESAHSGLYAEAFHVRKWVW